MPRLSSPLNQQILLRGMVTSTRTELFSRNPACRAPAATAGWRAGLYEFAPFLADVTAPSAHLSGTHRWSSFKKQRISTRLFDYMARKKKMYSLNRQRLLQRYSPGVFTGRRRVRGRGLQEGAGVRLAHQAGGVG